MFVLTLALTDGALNALHALDAAPPRGVELAVLVVAGFAATVTRYVAMKTWVFARVHRRATAHAERPAHARAGR